MPELSASRSGTSPFTPLVSPAATTPSVADCLGCIVEGRPLPEAARPAPMPVPPPCTTVEGIARIMTGRAARG